MKTYFTCCAALLLPLWAASCSRPANPVAEAVLPQAQFVKMPFINKGYLKAEISLSKPLNQHMTFDVGLQTLSRSADQIEVVDVDALLSQGELSSTSTESAFTKAATISINDDLKTFGFSKQYKEKVRLKIIMAQAEGTPDTWRQAKAHIVFSPWLDYK